MPSFNNLPMLFIISQSLISRFFNMEVYIVIQNKGIITETMVKHENRANVRIMKHNSKARMGLTLEGIIHIISLLWALQCTVIIITSNMKNTGFKLF
jgi:hypothetical protein